MSERRNTARRKGWKLVWRDEFEGDVIDTTKWDFDLGNGFYDYNNNAWIAGWGNEELQYYTREPENASVENSVLTIRAVKEAIHGCGYTSARLKTRKRDGTPLFVKQFGRIEFRAKVPWGKGLWPALWRVPQTDTYGGWPASGEIDLMEIVGERSHEVLNSIHFGSRGTDARQLITHVHSLPDGSTVADWHVYAVEWEPGEIRFYVDEVHTSSCNHWWSNFPGAPNAQTQFPAELAVDYVRVYDKVGGYGEVEPIGKGKFPWQMKPLTATKTT